MNAEAENGTNQKAKREESLHGRLSSMPTSPVSTMEKRSRARRRASEPQLISDQPGRKRKLPKAPSLTQQPGLTGLYQRSSSFHSSTSSGGNHDQRMWPQDWPSEDGLRHVQWSDSKSNNSTSRASGLSKSPEATASTDSLSISDRSFSPRHNNKSKKKSSQPGHNSLSALPPRPASPANSEGETDGFSHVQVSPRLTREKKAAMLAASKVAGSKRRTRKAEPDLRLSHSEAFVPADDTFGDFCDVRGSPSQHSKSIVSTESHGMQVILPTAPRLWASMSHITDNEYVMSSQDDSLQDNSAPENLRPKPPFTTEARGFLQRKELRKDEQYSKSMSHIFSETVSQEFRESRPRQQKRSVSISHISPFEEDPRPAESDPVPEMKSPEKKKRSLSASMTMNFFNLTTMSPDKETISKTRRSLSKIPATTIKTVAKIPTTTIKTVKKGAKNVKKGATNVRKGAISGATNVKKGAKKGAISVQKGARKLMHLRTSPEPNEDQSKEKASIPDDEMPEPPELPETYDAEESLHVEKEMNAMIFNHLHDDEMDASTNFHPHDDSSEDEATNIIEWERAGISAVKSHYFEIEWNPPPFVIAELEAINAEKLGSKRPARRASLPASMKHVTYEPITPVFFYLYKKKKEGQPDEADTFEHIADSTVWKMTAEEIEAAVGNITRFDLLHGESAHGKLILPDENRNPSKERKGSLSPVPRKEKRNRRPSERAEDIANQLTKAVSERSTWLKESKSPSESRLGTRKLSKRRGSNTSMEMSSTSLATADSKKKKKKTRRSSNSPKRIRSDESPIRQKESSKSPRRVRSEEDGDGRRKRTPKPGQSRRRISSSRTRRVSEPEPRQDKAERSTKSSRPPNRSSPKPPRCSKSPKSRSSSKTRRHGPSHRISAESSQGPKKTSGKESSTKRRERKSGSGGGKHRSSKDRKSLPPVPPDSLTESPRIRKTSDRNMSCSRKATRRPSAPAAVRVPLMDSQSSLSPHSRSSKSKSSKEQTMVPLMDSQSSPSPHTRSSKSKSSKEQTMVPLTDSQSPLSPHSQSSKSKSSKEQTMVPLMDSQSSLSPHSRSSKRKSSKEKTSVPLTDSQSSFYPHSRSGKSKSSKEQTMVPLMDSQSSPSPHSRSSRSKSSKEQTMVPLTDSQSSLSPHSRSSRSKSSKEKTTPPRRRGSAGGNSSRKDSNENVRRHRKGSKSPHRESRRRHSVGSSSAQSETLKKKERIVSMASTGPTSTTEAHLASHIVASFSSGNKNPSSYIHPSHHSLSALTLTSNVTPKSDRAVHVVAIAEKEVTKR
jgi:hypothetical protein